MSGTGNPVNLATSGTATIPAESYTDAAGNKMFGNVVHSVTGTGNAQVAQPVSSANPMPTRQTQATFAAVPVASITTAGTYQTAFAAGSITNGAYFVNTDSTNTGETLWVDLTGATGTTLSNAAVPVPAGGLYELPMAPTNAVTVYAATAGHTFKAASY